MPSRIFAIVNYINVLLPMNKKRGMGREKKKLFHCSHRFFFFFLSVTERISFCFDIYLGDVGGKRSRADHEDVNVERMSKPAKKKLIFSDDDISPLPASPPPDAPSGQESQQSQQQPQPQWLPPQQSMPLPPESLMPPPRRNTAAAVR